MRTDNVDGFLREVEVRSWPETETETDVDVCREGGGEDGLPLVETASPLPSSYYCRTASCVENPQATAMDALKAGDLRLLSDLLSEEGDRVEPDQHYPGETFKTLLQVAVEAGYTEAVKILLAGGAALSKIKDGGASSQRFGYSTTFRAKSDNFFEILFYFDFSCYLNGSYKF